jgi:DNA repair photolyase
MIISDDACVPVPNCDAGDPNDRLARLTMNGKPVIQVAAKTVINFASNFSHKLLCDGLTFSTGSACCYSCAFCYVPDLMRKNPHKIQVEADLSQIVIRRRGAIDVIRRQLTRKDGRSKFLDPADRRVIYSSPLVDVAANMDLVRETVDACRTILELTHWQIRLLSKSNLLPRIAAALADQRERMIFGVSTGTLDDALAMTYEEGAPKVSKRIESLHWLQDQGFRTFGMICPSLPLAEEGDYQVFAAECAKALRTERCEHVWAEVINVRGESMLRTCAALRAGGYSAEADRLERVSTDKEAWERYARSTFEAHARVYQGQPGKLRFLQYVNKASRTYWESNLAAGAVLL